eukprot:TRINITY_DN4715_c0_g1_i1.p1 TRINITY_DN4715_c0_g1~~TRINITY_DN4715_c0_g1_i1.p1  ORF type:complete len:320 (+),score=99.57 TRINITY_DN4715_c0_g1_i1:167-1126(+)
MHRSRNSAMTMLIRQPTQEQLAIEKAIRAKHAKSGTQASFDYIALDDKRERVLFIKSSVEEEGDLSVNKALLMRYPHMRINTTLLDAHLYVFSRWVLDALDEKFKEKKKISSIKEELVPYLISCQGSSRKQQELPPTAKTSPQELALTMASTYVSKDPSSPSDNISCFAYVMDKGYCTRATDVATYLEANRDIARSAAVYMPFEKKGKNNFIDESSNIHPQTQTGADCVVGAGSKMGERCSVKKSIIGKHCIIGDNVKITNSVIMDYVFIGHGCNITDSVICNSVAMKENCNIKDSSIGVNVHLSSKSDIKSESLSKDK